MAQVTFNARFTESETPVNAQFTESNDVGASFGVSQVIGGAYPSDDLPLMDGIADAGTSIYFSRSDHVHPSDTIKLNRTDRITNLELEEMLR